MNKKDLIEEIKWLDNEGETDELNLESLSITELKGIADNLLGYLNNRQNKWIDAFNEKEGNKTKDSPSNK